MVAARLAAIEVSYESPSWNMERLVMFPSVKTHKPNFYGYFFHVFFFLKEGIEKA
jgi:hypothetical protein